jgi:hypothetical protein
MVNLIEDVSKLTDVSEKTLNKFIPVCTYSIGHAVYESYCCKQSITEIDIGVGQIDIKVEDNTIKYRFVPSKELEKTLIQTVTTKSSPLIVKLDNNLQDKIDRAYKELI